MTATTLPAPAALLTDPLIPAVVLPDVDIEISRGDFGGRYATVHLAKDSYPELPATVLGQARRSGLSHWWFYLSAGATAGDGEPRLRTPEEARAALDEQLVALLTEIAAVNVRRALVDMVSAIPAR